MVQDPKISENTTNASCIQPGQRHRKVYRIGLEVTEKAVQRIIVPTRAAQPQEGQSNGDLQNGKAGNEANVRLEEADELKIRIVGLSSRFVVLAHAVVSLYAEAYHGGQAGNL